MPTRNAPPSRVALAATLTVGLVAFTGCSLVRDEDARKRDAAAAASTAPLPSPTATPSSPTGPPTAFNGAAATAFPEETVLDAAAGKDVVATLTAAAFTLRSTPALTTTATLAPAVGTFTDLFLDRDTNTGYTLAARSLDGRGTTVGTDGFTVQQVNLETGEATASATATVAKDSRGSAKAATGEIVGVVGDLALVDTWVPGSEGPHTVVAIDLQSGDIAWRVRGAELLATTPKLAIASTGREGDPGRVEAFRLATGDRKWSALDGTLAATVVGATDTHVVVARDDAVFKGSTLTRLSLADGTPGTPELTADWNWACTPSGAATIRRTAVCTLGDTHQVVGYDVSRGRTTWSLPDRKRFAPAVTLVQDGLVYGLLDNGVGVVLDALSGRDLTADSGAAPVAVNRFGAMVRYAGKAFFVPSGSEAGASPGTAE